MEKETVNEAPSLPSENETNAVVTTDHSAQDVANAFLGQYYFILRTNPQEAHNFYQDESIRSHPCDDGSMKSGTTLMGIKKEILASNIKEWKPDLSSVFAQDSLLRSVIVGVTGSLTDKNNVTRKYTQTFFLAPQEGGGFFVLNDFLQFTETNKISESEANVKAKDSSVEIEQPPNKDQADKSTSTKKEANVWNKVSDSIKGKDPLPAEATKKSVPSVWEPVQPTPSMQELAKRMSYASILAKEGSVAPSPQASPNSAIRVLPTTEKKPSVSLAVPKQFVPPLKPSSHPSNGPSENIYDVKAIRVKDLPQEVTQESLLEAVKKFGPVKQKNIQIKKYSEDGYRYAFVEFEHPKSAHFAVEERYIVLEGRDCEIQYKKSSPNQGGHSNNFTAKPQSGRGGFRTDNYWGRDGEGRSNNSWVQRPNEQENSGQHFGQTRDYNFRRNNNNNRYYQDQPRN